MKTSNVNSMPENKPHLFHNKSIIITGASKGIGLQLAMQLAEQGACLTLAARDKDLLDRAVELCTEKGGKAVAVPTDIAVEEQCRALINRANEAYGQIDMLINNAGVADKARFEDILSLTSAETVMRVNFWGSIYCTYFALPYLKQTGGRIVVLNSGAGKFPTPTSPFYGASKHALDGFFDSIRLELQPGGVTITTIYPDWVATGISKRSLGFNGLPLGQISAHENGAISPEKCARIIIHAAEKRKKMILLSRQQRIGYVLRPLFPKLIDRIAGNQFR